MSSTHSTPVYPVNESQSFIGSVLGSAAKNTLGKTLPSQSLNFATLIGSKLNDNRMHTNRTSDSKENACKY